MSKSKENVVHKQFMAQQEAELKFNKKAEVSAADARRIAETKGSKTIDEQVEAGWTAIMDQVKTEALDGKTYVLINIGVHDPEVRGQVIKRLDKAGFRHELVGAQGRIFW